MLIKHLPAGPLMVNCFILGDEASGEAVVIDPGGNVPDIVSIIEEHGLGLTAIINTHGHWDHTGGNADLKRAAGGRILIHQAEEARGFKPDGYLREGEAVVFGPHRLEILETPGHSPGGISLYFREVDAVFVGDLLFAGSIGRTDLPGGSFEVLVRSVRDKIYPLGDETRVLPGHGPMTSVGQEKRFNPFVKGVSI
ncbi:MAG: MBL fold metallo-hydrolase [Proteobacteria bacterium]|nr:MBL fold metallo-hydrolase [Pseudomonadota bacterium]